MTARQRAEGVVLKAAAEHFPWDRQIELIEQAVLAHAEDLRQRCAEICTADGCWEPCHTADMAAVLRVPLDPPETEKS